MLCNGFLQIGEVLYFLTIDADDDVVHLDIGTGSRTAIHNLTNPHAVYNAKLFAFIGQSSSRLVNRLVGHHVAVTRERSTLDSQQCTLYGSVLFQVTDHFGHHARRNGKTISGISTRG